jgi:hypothetical protein
VEISRLQSAAKLLQQRVSSRAEDAGSKGHTGRSGKGETDAEGDERMNSEDYEKLARREIAEKGNVSPSLAIKMLIHMKSLETPRVQIDKRMLDRNYGFKAYRERKVSA